MKRQFKTKPQPRQFYDKKIVGTGRTGQTRYLSVGKILPKNWLYVRVWKPKIDHETATLKIECLAKEPEVKARGVSREIPA